ncbi:hypothetical protein BDP55DRAFT_646542 [Colletotrichum godetiae]|uniref:Uncharacterized protein n=1 Tax=Colletotrichum godetiae TaxID=1209918 RepID=A0AAJ0AVS9_9PEZI|nr:uncharacterized protein BDP55DRAFT_646542 [Colletotrichum godetiae]KAK1691282.1 hypothetical protein BDP55DRAFT_646542 [Colletotrichum godetiae]
MASAHHCGGGGGGGDNGAAIPTTAGPPMQLTCPNKEVEASATESPTTETHATGELSHQGPRHGRLNAYVNDYSRLDDFNSNGGSPHESRESYDARMRETVANLDNDFTKTSSDRANWLRRFTKTSSYPANWLRRSTKTSDPTNRLNRFEKTSSDRANLPRRFPKLGSVYSRSFTPKASVAYHLFSHNSGMLTYSVVQSRDNGP